MLIILSTKLRCLVFKLCKKVMESIALIISKHTHKGLACNIRENGKTENLKIKTKLQCDKNELQYQLLKTVIFEVLKLVLDNQSKKLLRISTHIPHGDP